ncbi:MAG: amidohydrolase family protein [Panacagrimonas sp.]
MWLDDRQIGEVTSLDGGQDGWPVPTQMVSNGEFLPIAQTQDQKRVEHELGLLATRRSRELGMSRRDFLKTGAGMATAFAAMNTVFGTYFNDASAESLDLDAAAALRARLKDQLIVDVQLHFVRDDYKKDIVLALGEYAKNWNPVLEKEGVRIERYKFDHFLKEVYFDSDTTIGLVSAAPAEQGDNVIVGNAGLEQARRLVNAAAGSRRMLCHSVMAPGQKGWLEEIDKAIEVYKPDGWKGYTLGDPFENSHFPWRMDDEKLMYPAYEKMMKSGIRTVCIHKGLLPDDYQRSLTNWRYAMVDDVGKAAKDWPELKFVIYHSGLRMFLTDPGPTLDRFDKTGQIDWVTDLAAVPEKYGVSNVYAELGTTFGSCVVTHPKLAAAILGSLIKGMGADHVVWGTDSVWYGSPQWQIDAFRRIEIPPEMQKTHGFAPLGAADGNVKSVIFGGNAVGIFNLQKDAAEQKWRGDLLSQAKAEYLAAGGKPSNQYYGFIRKSQGQDS